ncbi:hypothetical protein I603_1479 [Erythrobacter dokdonensis DSW-74]|uniref:Uncharacterized protein n=1 Tax=Erythrobacter dokdonensis DSW-74 TaxID=1300349 RepID=A0A1A7BH74_9SPHN|nr:hypothetical protein I603_1479 [Erythrobacter dokdonensis DSW-74]
MVKHSRAPVRRTSMAPLSRAPGEHKWAFALPCAMHNVATVNPRSTILLLFAREIRGLRG